VFSPTYQQNWSDEPGLIDRRVTDKSLVMKAHGYVVDLWVYDDHFAAAKSMKVSSSIFWVERQCFGTVGWALFAYGHHHPQTPTSLLTWYLTWCGCTSVESIRVSRHSSSPGFF